MGAGDLRPAQEGPAERDRVVEGDGDFPGDGVRVAGHPELAERGRQVEVDPLAHHLVAFEREHDEHGKVHAAPGRRQPPPRPLVGAPERALHHDDVVGVVEVGDVVVEVGEGGYILLHEPTEWTGTVEDLTGGHELIARPREEPDRLVKPVGVLRPHMPEADLLAPLPEIFVDCHRRRR